MYTKRVWIAREYSRCSGCRKCEIECSLHHEGKIWPEASMIRIFMLVPGLEVPHLCVQCEDYPCVESCPSKALSVNENTGAVLVDEEKCNACGICVSSCPGMIPHLHPKNGHAIICDLCDGDPKCVKICQEGGWGALWLVQRAHPHSKALYKLYSRTPEEVTKDLSVKIYGKKGKELI